MYKDKLKNVRTLNNVTQQTIADYLKIHRARYNQYENETDIFPIIHLNDTCNFFDISLDYIFGFSDIKQYKNSIKEIDEKNVGNRLKTFRKNEKITQVKLAENLNTNQSVIANYERGRNIIATPFLYQICKKYKISADYLLGKVDEPKYLD